MRPSCTASSRICPKTKYRRLWCISSRSNPLEKVACGAFCACPSLDGTLRVDLRSTKRAPARLSDISFVSAGKKRGFCQLHSRLEREGAFADDHGAAADV